jgi:glutamate dehydrogenase/leucine dehydrogenase
MLHEQVVIKRGERSGLPVIVAVHSTARGQAIGGCRIKHYPDWRDGLEDALRLSSAMTDKCALAGLPHGGGKTVVARPPGATVGRDVLLDVGDVIAGLGGSYATGPDVGTGPEDMVTVGERTPYVFCRPAEAGGSGDSSSHTAVGVIAALEALCAERFGSPELSRRSFALLGLGHVGGYLWQMLTDAGADVIAADVDDAKKRGNWVTPEECLTAEVDVLIPAALGGLLTRQSVPILRCAAIAGPANNQLDAPATAGLLHERGILWAPDAIVSAGGIIYATGVELQHLGEARASERVRGIAVTLAEVLREAAAAGEPPAEAARRRVERALK